MDNRTIPASPLSELKRMDMFGLLNAHSSLTALPTEEMKKYTSARWVTFAVLPRLGERLSDNKDRYLRTMAFRYLADCWAEGQDPGLATHFNSALHEPRAYVQDAAISGLAQSGKVIDGTLARRLATTNEVEKAATAKIAARLDELIVDGTSRLIPGMKIIRNQLTTKTLAPASAPRRPKAAIAQKLASANYELPFGSPQ